MSPVKRWLREEYSINLKLINMCFAQHTDNCKHKKEAANEQRTEQISEYVW